MIRYVHLDKNLTRQLRRLHQAGGRSKSAAEHAEAIIRQWLSGEIRRPKQSTRSTRFGETRIKNCFKYDLVEAYRLLAVIDEDHLIFLFVGSHSECDQWICHNIGWKPGVMKRRNEILPVRRTSMKPAAGDGQSEEGNEAEDYILREIDEQDLRIIFAGICRSRGNRGAGNP